MSHTDQTLKEFLVQMRVDAIEELEDFAAQLTKNCHVMLKSGQDAFMAAGREAAARTLLAGIDDCTGPDQNDQVIGYMHRSMALVLRHASNSLAHQAQGDAYGEISDFISGFRRKHGDAPLI